MQTDEVDRLKWIAQICQTPEDDNVRLYFADWLEEHGEGERGEFIRVQCDLAKLPEPEEKTQGHEGEFDIRNHCVECRKTRPAYCKYHALTNRWREILAKNRIVWEYGFPWAEFEWSRGFVSSVTCTAEDWLRHGDDLTWGWAKCERCEGGKIWAAWPVKHEGAIYPGRKRVDCPTCSGLGRVPPTRACLECGYWEEGEKIVMHCEECKDSGRVHRPCPPTAQPITEVRLTTHPRETGNINEFALWTNGDGSTWRSDRWPGVTFHLPQTGSGYDRLVRVTLEDIVRGSLARPFLPEVPFHQSRTA